MGPAARRADGRRTRGGACLKLRLLTVGKAPPWIDAGFAEYAGRLPRENALELHLVSPRRGQTDEQRLLAAARPRETVAIFDRRGQPLDSPAFANLLSRWRQAGRDVALVIGGADGFAAASRASAAHVLSLSALTFPHQLARLVVAEQVYRAWTILSGHPYHR